MKNNNSNFMWENLICPLYLVASAATVALFLFWNVAIESPTHTATTSHLLGMHPQTLQATKAASEALKCHLYQDSCITVEDWEHVTVSIFDNIKLSNHRDQATCPVH